MTQWRSRSQTELCRATRPAWPLSPATPHGRAGTCLPGETDLMFAALMVPAAQSLDLFLLFDALTRRHGDDL